MPGAYGQERMTDMGSMMDIRLRALQHIRNGVLARQYTTAAEALENNKTKLPPVFERDRVTNPRLFGSVARGDADDQSDIDILVSKTGPMDYATIGALRREVTATLGWPTQLVFESALRPEVREEIQKDLRPLF